MHDRSLQSWNWMHPALLLMMLALAALALHTHWNPMAALAVGLLMTLAWIAFWEHQRPYRQDWLPQRQDLRRDGWFALFTILADSLGGLLVRLAALAILLYWPLTGYAQDLPMLLAVPLALLLAELGDYWLHRLSHRGGWLWQVHLVHHRPAVLHVSNNFLSHPVNVLLRKVLRELPIWAMGFSPEALLTAALLAQAQSFAAHANWAGRLGYLNYFLGSAQLHRWHHSVQHEEALNFATAWPLWDQVFGTFYYHPELEVAQIGLSQTEPGEHDKQALLCQPFPCCRAL